MFIVVAYNVFLLCHYFLNWPKKKKGNIFENKIKKDVILVFVIGMFVALGFYFLWSDYFAGRIQKHLF